MTLPDLREGFDIVYYYVLAKKLWQMLPFEVLVLFFFLFVFKADEQAVVAWNLKSTFIFLYKCSFWKR